MKFKRISKGKYKSDYFDIDYCELSSSSSGFPRPAGWRLCANGLARQKLGKSIFLKFDTLKEAKAYAEQLIEKD